METSSNLRQRRPGLTISETDTKELTQLPTSTDAGNNLDFDVIYPRSSSIFHPWNLSEELHRKYMRYRKRIHGYSDFASQFPTVLMAFVHMVTDDSSKNPNLTLRADLLLKGSLLIILVTAITHLIYSFARLALARKWYCSDNCKDRQMRKKLRYIAREMFWGHMEDACLTLCNLSSVMHLVGSLLTSDNTERTAAVLPAELTMQLFLMYVNVLVTQQFKVVTFAVVVANWFIAVAAYFFTSYYAGVGPSYATMFACHVFVFTSFEYERRWRVSYLQFRKIANRQTRDIIKSAVGGSSKR